MRLTRPAVLVMRGMHDDLDRLIAQASAAMRALAADATLFAVVTTVKPMLGAYISAGPELAGAVCAAVDRLRYVAITRPSLVDDTRRLARPG